MINGSSLSSYNKEVLKMIKLSSKAKEIVKRSYEENKIEIQKRLRNLKPFKKVSLDEEIHINDIEKALKIMSKKYDVSISKILWVLYNDDKYSLRLFSHNPLMEICRIEESTIYGLLAKALVIMSMIKEGE